MIEKEPIGLKYGNNFLVKAFRFTFNNISILRYGVLDFSLINRKVFDDRINDIGA